MSQATRQESAATAQLRDAIVAFEPFNEQEAADKQIILQALDNNPNCFERSAQAHMACSIWVVDPTMSQTLLVYHNIYDSWSWIGGHADGERDLEAVALRELQEETGVENARIVPVSLGNISPVFHGHPEVVVNVLLRQVATPLECFGDVGIAGLLDQLLNLEQHFSFFIFRQHGLSFPSQQGS